MIDITHKQAQRWIRESLDHRLPDTQWTALQAHLESCKDCRAYSDRLNLLERGLRRALKGSWSSVSGPADSTPERVVVQRRALLRWRRQALATVVGMTSLVVFYLLGGFDRLFQPANDSAALVPVAGQPAIPTGTPLPTVQAGEFHGVVAYDAITDDGRRALFLLNPATGPDAGPEQLVLGGVPETGAGERSALYNDRAPSWSPDGEWLAFLSDRGSQTGKEELFVTNVAGSRVVQLTDLADVEWEAPLSWSADGQWIALTGARSNQGGQRWVYRVPIDTAKQGGPVAVAGSRNGFSPEYAPFGDRLAYGTADGDKGGVVIDHIESGERVSANWQKNDLGQPPAAGAAFDWSSDGTGLVYIAGQSPGAAESGAGSAGAGSTDAGSTDAGSQVVAVRDLNYSISLFYDFLHNFQITQSRWSGAYHAVTWTPSGAVVYLEDLDDARANDQPGQTTSGCWTLQFRRLGSRASNGDVLSLSALCVESGLDRSSWTPDGDWLVVVGRTAEEISAGSPRGIYAVHVPQLRDNENPRVVRLGSVTGAASTPRVRPLARGYNNPPVIDPRPVNGPDISSASRPTPQGIVNLLLGSGSDRADSQPDARRGPQPSDLSKAAGQVFFSHDQGNGSVIARMNPDGTGGRLLYASDGYNTCPSPAPNGQWIAFASDIGSEAVQPSGKSPVVPDLNGPAQIEGTPTVQFASDSAFQSANGNEIYLVDSDGSGMVAISSPESLTDADPSLALNAPFARYGCPSWSPDGSALAVVVQTPQQWYLGVMPVKDGRPDLNKSRRYLRIDPPAGTLAPQWIGWDRVQIILPVKTQGKTSPTLLTVTVPDAPSQRLTSVSRVIESSSDGIAGMAASPSGQDFGWLTMYDTGDDRSLITLGLMGPNVSRSLSMVPIGMDYTGKLARYNPLSWLTTGEVGLVLHAYPDARVKSTINILNILTHELSIVAEVEDTLFDVAWSPDGRWLIYASESGLWGLDVQGALAGSAVPVWLSPQPVEHLSWR